MRLALASSWGLLVPKSRPSMDPWAEAMFGEVVDVPHRPLEDLGRDESMGYNSRRVLIFRD